ncbi:hypothetical protein BASA81_013275 [Batrachochytrium salamandrivorans]|nr:hypothetical protein BASA81_013275 [Batrachochytrium salamandrivorans]
MACCITEGIASISPPATPKPFPAATTTSLDADPLERISGSFSHPGSFNPIYQRNNKKGNIKNLRCFPACAKDSHKHRGFCGRSVSVSFELPLSPTSIFYSFVEFVPEGNLPQAKLSWEQAQTLLRSKNEPTRPWIPGVAQYPSLSPPNSNNHRMQYYEYNTELKGWHYSWESNKHKCDTKHHLVAMLYERQGDWLVLRSSCTSPSFILFCRRRKRFVLDHTEPGGGERTAMEEEEEDGDEANGVKRARMVGEKDDDDDATAALMAFMGCPRE